MTKLLMCVLAFMTAGQGSPVRPEQEDCAPAQPSRVWSTIVPASVKTRVEPAWPYLQNFDAHGTIILDVWIDETGEVACIKVIRPVPVFDRAAVEPTPVEVHACDPWRPADRRRSDNQHPQAA